MTSLIARYDDPDSDNKNNILPAHSNPIQKSILSSTNLRNPSKKGVPTTTKLTDIFSNEDSDDDDILNETVSDKNKINAMKKQQNYE